MMKILRQALISAGIATALLLSSFQASQAGTIIKLDLSDDSAADYRYSGGVLSTIDDGNPLPHGLTAGDQTTDIEFLDFLSSIPGIEGGSYTLAGVTAIGAPLTFSIGGVPHVAQDFQGGTFQIWDEDDNLLLDVLLAGSALVGPIGNPATGSAFTTTFADVQGGSLAGYIAEDSLSMAISMTSIVSTGPTQSGLRLTGGGLLRPFTADATKLIAASPLIPEPTAAILLLLGAMIELPLIRRARRR